jgi:alpha-L-fucosidase
MYYKSAGYGGVMLLNCSPDTMGRVNEGDRATYLAFGNEISRRFKNPLKSINNLRGNTALIHFSKPVLVNHFIIQEDYSKGHRIREYKTEGKVNGKWVALSEGISVGRKKIDAFANKRVSAVRLTVTKAVDTPLIRSFSVFNVSGYVYKPGATEGNEWKICGEWNTKTFKNGKDTMLLDLSRFIITPGQYEVKFIADVSVTGTSIDSAEIRFEDQNTLQQYLQRKDYDTFYINRTSQVVNSSSSVLKLYMHSDNQSFQNRGIFKIRKRGAK